MCKPDIRCLSYDQQRDRIKELENKVEFLKTLCDENDLIIAELETDLERMVKKYEKQD